MRRRALLSASAESGGGKIDNFVSIQPNGMRYNVIFDYPCDVPLIVYLGHYDKYFISITAGTSSYNLGRAPLLPHITNIEPQSNSIYNYLW
jgi:hypothetical protein